MQYISENQELLKMQSVHLGGPSVYIKAEAGDYTTGGICDVSLFSIVELAESIIKDALSRNESAKISFGTLSGEERCREIVESIASRKDVENCKSMGMDARKLLVQAMLNAFMQELLEYYAKHD